MKQIDVDEFIAQLRERLNASTVRFKFDALCVGIASLYAFVQTAWTGPDVSFSISEHLGLDSHRTRILKSLGADGEEAYVLIPHPLLLLIAKLILIDCSDCFAEFQSYSWWKCRCAFIQQRILDNPAASLQAAMTEAIAQLDSSISEFAASNRELKARAYLEQGLIHHFYGQDAKAVELFDRAQEASGLVWALTGALGKRTKFQTFEVSQLVVLAESLKEQNCSSTKEEKSAAAPNTLPLNDDTLLETVDITVKTPSQQDNLSVIDQAILLAFCMNVKNTNPDHGLTIEQIFPYVRRVLQHPNNWMVHTMALLLRSRLESVKSRTVERAALQLQALVDQFNVDDSANYERMLHIFSIMMPPKWELEVSCFISFCR